MYVVLSASRPHVSKNMKRGKGPVYVSFQATPGRIKCGKCFRGRIVRVTQLCKVCGARNWAIELEPRNFRNQTGTPQND